MQRARDIIQGPWEGLGGVSANAGVSRTKNLRGVAAGVCWTIKEMGWALQARREQGGGETITNCCACNIRGVQKTPKLETLRCSQKLWLH